MLTIAIRAAPDRRGEALGALPSLLLGADGDVLISRRVGLKEAPFRAPRALQAAYAEAMLAEAYGSVSGLVAEHYHTHHRPERGTYAGAGGGRAQGSSARLMTVSAEMAQLAASHDTVHWASSILVRADAAAMDFMRVAITGPAGTPYQNGFFVFDVSLPQEYPQVNPNVQL